VRVVRRKRREGNGGKAAEGRLVSLACERGKRGKVAYLLLHMLRLNVQRVVPVLVELLDVVALLGQQTSIFFLIAPCEFGFESAESGAGGTAREKESQ
jgi:hypothetical protein